MGSRMQAFAAVAALACGICAGCSGISATPPAQAGLENTHDASERAGSSDARNLRRNVADASTVDATEASRVDAAGQCLLVQKPTCVEFCGSDFNADAICQGSQWACPPGFVDLEPCPRGSCGLLRPCCRA